MVIGGKKNSSGGGGSGSANPSPSNKQIILNRGYKTFKFVNEEESKKTAINSNMSVKEPTSKSSKFKKLFSPRSSNKMMAFDESSKRSSAPSLVNLRNFKSSQFSSTSLAPSSVNIFSVLNKHSWLNYKVEQKNQRLYIKEYKSSPLEVEVSFITRVKMDIDLADK